MDVKSDELIKTLNFDLVYTPILKVYTQSLVRTKISAFILKEQRINIVYEVGDRRRNTHISRTLHTI